MYQLKCYLHSIGNSIVKYSTGETSRRYRIMNRGRYLEKFNSVLCNEYTLNEVSHCTMILVTSVNGFATNFPVIAQSTPLDGIKRKRGKGEQAALRSSADHLIYNTARYLPRTAKTRWRFKKRPRPNCRAR